MLSILRAIAKLVSRRGIRTSYSQDGEDLLIENFLRNKKRGTYVDVGTYHPILYSNTYRFYRRGWRGVVIDANSDLKLLYRIFRRRDRFVIRGVGLVAEERTYYKFSDGAYNTFEASQAKTLKKNRHITFLGSERISITPLHKILEEAGVTEVDFLSIDIEGMDIEALQSYPWRLSPRVIAIEDNTFSVSKITESPICAFLADKGYYLGAFAGRTLIFVLK